MDVQMFVYTAVAVFVLIVGIGAISGQLKGPNRKAEKAKLEIEKLKAEIQSQKVRYEADIARKEQEILKAQKDLQYKKDHPEKFSDWSPKNNKD